MWSHQHEVSTWIPKVGKLSTRTCEVEKRMSASYSRAHTLSQILTISHINKVEVFVGTRGDFHEFMMPLANFAAPGTGAHYRGSVEWPRMRYEDFGSTNTDSLMLFINELYSGIDIVYQPTIQPLLINNHC